MNTNIEGKVIVITGASSGLGEAAARYLTSKSAIVALGARRVDRIQSLANELNGKGGKALAIATDVTKYDQVKALVDAAVQTFFQIILHLPAVFSIHKIFEKFFIVHTSFF